MTSKWAFNGLGGVDSTKRLGSKGTQTKFARPYGRRAYENHWFPLSFGRLWKPLFLGEGTLGKGGSLTSYEKTVEKKKVAKSVFFLTDKLKYPGVWKIFPPAIYYTLVGIFVLPPSRSTQVVSKFQTATQQFPRLPTLPLKIPDTPWKIHGRNLQPSPI